MAGPSALAYRDDHPTATVTPADLPGAILTKEIDRLKARIVDVEKAMVAERDRITRAESDVTEWLAELVELGKARDILARKEAN